MNRCSASPQTSACDVCPLSIVQAGVEVRIKRLAAKPEIQMRLREMGIREEQIIRLLSSQTSYICKVCNARVAISDRLANFILVERLQPVAI